MTLYLKYRPQTLEELGLKEVREHLKGLLASKKSLPHAFLFTGPRGTGKTSAARILAKELDPNISLDLIEIDAASNRGIDEIRTLREQVGLAPMQSKYKVYVIDEVHMLTTEAANALLKTLEEPPSHVIFILCTTDPQKLPETVISRCTRIQFKKPKLEEIVNKLKIITEQEKWTMDSGELTMIAKEAKGSFRDAIKILEQVITSGKPTREVLGMLEDTDPHELITLINTNQTQNALSFINNLVNQGINLRTFIERCVEVLREELLETHDKKIIDLIEEFEKAYVQTKEAAVPQLPLEILVIKRISPMTKPQVSSPKQTPMTNDLNDLMAKWPEVLRVVKPQNHSVEGLLRSTKPVAFDGHELTLEVFYKFHKDKLETAACRQIVEDGVAAVLNVASVKLKLKLGEKQNKPEEEDLSVLAQNIFK